MAIRCRFRGWDQAELQEALKSLGNQKGGYVMTMGPVEYLVVAFPDRPARSERTHFRKERSDVQHH
jgi:hypothetical protein